MPPGPGTPGGGGSTLSGLALTSVGRPIWFWIGGIGPAAGGITPGPPSPGGGSIPIACIRARCVAAWVLAQGKGGPGAKYWTSSCMYLPDGKVMPAYSTWQPVDGSSQPIDSPAQSARRRSERRSRRGVPVREEAMGSTLLSGASGGRAEPRGDRLSVNPSCQPED